MGYDASCTLRHDGTATRGTAWLEARDLVFRGPRRLSIPLASITSVAAAGGVLQVRYGDKSAEFEIGTAAEKWAARIACPRSRLQKLGVKPGMRVAIVGSIEQAFLDELASAGAVVLAKLPRPGSHLDLVFLAVEKSATLERLSGLKARINASGGIWVVRPKGKAGVAEAVTMAAGRRAGLVDVKVVAFSDTHTAEKFVIPLDKRPR